MTRYLLTTAMRGVSLLLLAIVIATYAENSDVYFSIIAVSAIFVTVTSFSLQNIVNRVSYNLSISKQVFSAAVTISLVIFVICFFAAVLFGSSAEVYLFLLYSLFKSTEMMSDSLLVAMGRRIYLSNIILLNILTVTTIIILLYIEAISDLYMVLLSQSLMGLLIYSVYVLQQHYRIKIYRVATLALKIFKNYKNLIIPLSITSVGGVLLTQGDKVILGLLGEANQLSEYSVTYLCCFFTYRFFTTSYLQMVASNFYRTRSESSLRLNFILGLIFVLIANFSFYIFISIYNMASILPINYDDQILLPLLVSSILAYVYIGNTIKIKYVYKAHIIMWVQVLFGLLTVFLNIILIPIFGIQVIPWILMFIYFAMCITTISYNPAWSLQ